MITEFKIFENKSNLKKYLLLHNNIDKNLYYVLEVSNLIHSSSEDYILTKKLYKFNKQDNIVLKTSHQYYSVFLSNFDRDVMYQSDDLKKILDILPTLKDVDNYNL